MAAAPRGRSDSSSFYGHEGFSLTGASGLARLLFLRIRNVHRVLPHSHTHSHTHVHTRTHTLLFYCHCIIRAGCPEPLHTFTHQIHSQVFRHHVLRCSFYGRTNTHLLFVAPLHCMTSWCKYSVCKAAPLKQRRWCHYYKTLSDLT